MTEQQFYKLERWIDAIIAYRAAPQHATESYYKAMWYEAFDYLVDDAREHPGSGIK